MNKNKIIIIILIIAIIGIGTFVIMNTSQGNNAKQTENNVTNNELSNKKTETETQNTTTSTVHENKVTSNSNNNTTSSATSTTNYSQEEEKEKTFKHTALSGCVITSTNGTQVTYRNKCEYCQYEGTSNNSIYHSSGTYSTSFTCPDCKKVNSIKIETESN